MSPAGDDFYFVVEGADGTQDANYEIRIQNIDSADAAANNSRPTTASSLGTVGSLSINSSGYTITRPDRDFYQFSTGAYSGELEISIQMPDYTGTSYPEETNLGLRVRNASRQIIGSSNDTGTEETVTLTVGTEEVYYVEGL